MDIGFIMVRAHHSLIYIGEMAAQHFRIRTAAVLQREEKQAIGHAENGGLYPGGNRPVSLIECQPFAADGQFGFPFRIIWVFGFDKETLIGGRGCFHVLEENGPDAMAPEIFHNGKIV